MYSEYARGSSTIPLNMSFLFLYLPPDFSR